MGNGKFAKEEHKYPLSLDVVFAITVVLVGALPCALFLYSSPFAICTSLSYIVVFLLLIADFLLLVHHREVFNKQSFLNLTVFIIFMVASFAAQLVFESNHLAVLSLGICALLSLIESQITISHVLCFQEKAISEYESALENEKLRTASYQVKPHFIGNTLSAIHYLCLSNPQEAAKSCDLLASHMDAASRALATTSCIPLEDELLQVRNYLEIRHTASPEKVRYQISSRAPGCLVPPLSVVTLVENSVSHGVMPKPQGGSVYVRAVEFADHYEVTVRDDGVGFNVSSYAEVDSSGKAHTGLANTRYRIEHMRHGELKVESSPGKGTCATLVVPKAET